MSEWGQPRGRLDLDGKTCRLRILDPATAFELEHELIEHLGEDLILTLATPAVVTQALADATITATDTGSVRISTAGLEMIMGFASRIMRTELDPKWVIGLFGRTIFDRLTVDREPIESWRDLKSSRLTPLSRWRLLTAQLVQTYGPLWKRSPYSASSRTPKDYGVPEPTATRTVQWAASLASQGYATSAREILATWTPGAMIDHVEIAAQAAELSRRASDAARSDGA